MYERKRLRARRARIGRLGRRAPRRVRERRPRVSTGRGRRRYGGVRGGPRPWRGRVQLGDPASGQTQRDILDTDDFEDLLGGHGISEDSTVVLYGDNSNWFAAYAYWQFQYYGHGDVRLLDGGRDYWVENDYPLTDEVPEFSAVDYEASGPRESIRAYRDDVEKAIDRGVPLVDVRSPEEFSGEVLAPPGLQETAQRGGHIPGAKNISWAAVTNGDGTFKTREELEELYGEEGIDGEGTTVAYCRIGERSSVAWFALHELLGYEDTVNYDGSWTEWGNLVDAPIETGEGG